VGVIVKLNKMTELIRKLKITDKCLPFYVTVHFREISSTELF